MSALSFILAARHCQDSISKKSITDICHTVLSSCNKLSLQMMSIVFGAEKPVILTRMSFSQKQVYPSNWNGNYQMVYHWCVETWEQGHCKRCRYNKAVLLQFTSTNVLCNMVPGQMKQNHGCWYHDKLLCQSQVLKLLDQIQCKSLPWLQHQPQFLYKYFQVSILKSQIVYLKFVQVFQINYITEVNGFTIIINFKLIFKYFT